MPADMRAGFEAILFPSQSSSEVIEPPCFGFFACQASNAHRMPSSTARSVGDVLHRAHAVL